MRYQMPSFTLPACNGATEVQWDMAFLTTEEFLQKYGFTPEGYLKVQEYPCADNR